MSTFFCDPNSNAKFLSQVLHFQYELILPSPMLTSHKQLWPNDPTQYKVSLSNRKTPTHSKNIIVLNWTHTVVTKWTLTYLKVSLSNIIVLEWTNTSQNTIVTKWTLTYLKVSLSTTKTCWGQVSETLTKDLYSPKNTDPWKRASHLIHTFINKH